MIDSNSSQFEIDEWRDKREKNRILDEYFGEDDNEKWQICLQTDN